MPNKLLEKAFWFIFGSAIVLQFVMPFIYPIVGHDAAVHLNWLEQFPRLFREGNLYPRWMPDSFWGFGSPAFYFYPPLAYWCASLISFVFPDSPVAIYQTLGLLATIASVGTCYLYLRSIVDDKRAALMGALVYGIFPYRLLDLYLRNAIGEHIAFIFLPLIFLGVEYGLKYSTKKKNIIGIIISAIGWAGLLISNIPTSIIAIYIFPVYSLIRARRYRAYINFFFQFIGALIGCMIASIYLFPIPEYIGSIKPSHLWDLQIQQGNSGFAIIDIIHGNYRYFYIGLLIVVATGAWLIYGFTQKRKVRENKNIITAFLVFLGLSVILQIPYVSEPLTRYLPYFRLIQFSYRWNILIVLASAVYIALYFKKANANSSKWFIGISSVVTIILAVGYFITMDGLHWQYNHSPGHIDAPEYMSRYADNNFEIAKNRLKDHAMDDLITSMDGSLPLHLYSAASETLRFGVDSSKSKTDITFHRMDFSAWKLKRERTYYESGLPHVETMVTFLLSDSLGRIKDDISILPLKANYILYLDESKTEKIGKLLSIIGISILGILICLTIFWRNPKAS